MKASWTTWLAIILWLLTIGITVCTFTLMYLNERLSELWREGVVVFPVAVFTLASVGALLAAHRPRNPIGWIFLAAGLSQILNGVIDEYAFYIEEVAPGTLPELVPLVWLSGWVWTISFFLPPTFGILLFPTGRLPSQRWRPFAWFIVVCITIFITEIMIGLGPFGFLLSVFGLIAFPFIFLGSVLSIFIRMRRADERERQQIKWFALAATIPLTGLAVDLILGSLTSFDTSLLFFLVVFLGIAIFPVAIGIAILRHNLYDIDRLINRTLVYGLLTALVILGFVGSVVFFQFLLDPLTSGNDLAVAGSTLLVAALFRPARNRLQRFVDRRFYRRKYDARQTLQTFSVTARDAVNLDQLSGELTSVVVETVQPEHVSVWLRPAKVQSGHNQ